MGLVWSGGVGYGTVFSFKTLWFGWLAYILGQVAFGTVGQGFSFSKL